MRRYSEELDVMRTRELVAQTSSVGRCKLTHKLEKAPPRFFQNLIVKRIYDSAFQSWKLGVF